jgi:peroxiredoxin
MHLFSLIWPFDLPNRQSVLCCEIERRAYSPAIFVLAILAAFAARATRAQEASTDEAGESKIDQLVRSVRAEEAKFQDLEVVTRRSRRGVPGSTAQSEEETLDSVRQSGLCYAHVRIVRALNSGDIVKQDIVSAFDRERTRTVEIGNSVNVHLRRYELSQVVPPHSWVLGAWQVNFDLSTFLGGMPALQKDRKVRISRNGGTIFEFWNLDFQLEGEETIEGLRCMRIRCQRWNAPQRGPYLALIWLARDRNLIAVRMQASFDGTMREPPDLQSAVKEWRQIGPGLWLPARIHSERNVGNSKVRRTETEDLTLERARLHPERQVAFFRDVPMPKELPVFTIDAEGHLADDFLLHTKAVAYPRRRMQEVLDKIRENEAFYHSFEATIETHDQAVRPDSSGMISRSRDQAIDVVRQGGRFCLSGRDEYHRSSVTGPSNSTRRGLSKHLTAFDGRWSRSLQLGELGETLEASLQPADNLAWSDYAPHLLPFDRVHVPKSASLADWLTADLVDSMNHQWKNNVKYLGSEIRDGLACDVVELVTGNRGRADNVGPRELIWIAKDRNYLPVRLEWRPRGEPLPSVLTQVEVFREASPGVWYPQRMRRIAFATTPPALGVLEHRLIVQERRETVVRSFDLAPKSSDSEFHDVVVRAHMPVHLRDVGGKDVGSIMPEETGVVTLTDSEWTELVLKRLRAGMRGNEEPRELQKRLATANSLIGKAPPELPRTWVNGTAIDWKDLKGKTVLLCFWALWDEESCRQATRLSAQIVPLKAASIAVVGAHAMGTPPADVERAVKQFKLSFPVCIDPQPTEKLLEWGPLWTEFGVRTLPGAVVIDATGHVADFGAIDAMLFRSRELAHRRQ